jgi:molybdopterin/thiamine biosynthesis adenylyltransferase
LLAKSGVGNLILIDPEKLGWENIRRHQLGSAAVGQFKASYMATAIAQQNPDIRSTAAAITEVEVLLAHDPTAISDVDLVVACTAAWSANSALDALSRAGGPPVVYGWMEAHAVAAHALLIGEGDAYSDGFDEAGNPFFTASVSKKPIPAECGAQSSPFGAIELAQAEALTARLALDFLRGKVTGTTWRTWLTDAEYLAESEAHWTPEWVEARGVPDAHGGISTGGWPRK